MTPPDDEGARLLKDGEEVRVDGDDEDVVPVVYFIGEEGRECVDEVAE